jgi:hypothetical protein
MILKDLEIYDDDGHYHVADPELCDIGSKILIAYYSQAPAYTGRQVRVSKKDHIFFYRAAEYCKELGETPEVFVRRQLEGMALTSTFYPRAIGSKTLRKVADSSSDTRSVAIGRYRAQLELFTRLVMIYGPTLLLEDGCTQFSPLFRCVMAHSYKLESIVSRCIDHAIAELQANPVAQDVFADSLGFINDYVSKRAGLQTS